MTYSPNLTEPMRVIAGCNFRFYAFVPLYSLYAWGRGFCLPGLCTCSPLLKLDGDNYLPVNSPNNGACAGVSTGLVSHMPGPTHTRI